MMIFLKYQLFQFIRMQKTQRISYLTNILCHSFRKSNYFFQFTGFHCHVIKRLCNKTTTAKFENSVTVGDVLNKWTQTFGDNSIAEPKESIQFIVCHELNIETISDIFKNHWIKHTLTQKQVDNITSMCQKRLQSFPVQYILEEWTFRYLTLKMKAPVFIPRPETEELVELVKNDIILTGANEIVELCCGSGAICLSLLKEIPNISIVAVDKSKEACLLTTENSSKNNISDRLTVIQHEICFGKEIAGIFSGKDNFYDIIVSNPPYVLSKDMEGLQQEIKLHEDLAALDGGLDGMDVIKPILRLSSIILRTGGRLYLEVDPSHPDIIRTLLNSDIEECKQGGIEKQAKQLEGTLVEYRNLGLRIRNVHEDFNKKPRFVEIVKMIE